MSDNAYLSEINFIRRKVPTIRVNWKPLPALFQIASPPTPPADAQKIIAALKDSLIRRIERDIKDLAAKGLGKTAVEIFNKMIVSVNSKLGGGVRIIIHINILREIFGNEIDYDWGGGGKSYNPFSNKPKPPGRGV